MQDLPDLVHAYNALPQDQQDVLALYRQSGHWVGGAAFAYEINTELRANAVRPVSRPFIDLIDRALASYSLKYPATVYRAECDVASIPSLTVGTTWRPRSFISTSTWWGNLHTHLPSAGRGQTAAIITIRLPPGTSAAYLGAAPSASVEREVLLGRANGFRILGIADGDIGRYVGRHLAANFAGMKEIIVERAP
jgi:hypothetical protein